MEQGKRDADIRNELKRHGVEDVKLKPGMDIREVQKFVKDTGNATRDRLQAQAARQEAATRAKLIERNKALKGQREAYKKQMLAKKPKTK